MKTILVNSKKICAYALRRKSEGVLVDYVAVTTPPGENLVRESAIYSVIFEDYAFDFQLLPSFPLRMPRLSDIESMAFNNEPEVSSGISFPFPAAPIPYTIDFKRTKTETRKVGTYGIAGQGKMRPLMDEESEIVRKAIEGAEQNAEQKTTRGEPLGLPQACSICGCKHSSSFATVTKGRQEYILTGTKADIFRVVHKAVADGKAGAEVQELQLGNYNHPRDVFKRAVKMYKHLFKCRGGILMFNRM